MSVDGHTEEDQLLSEIRRQLRAQHLNLTGVNINAVAKQMTDVVPRNFPGNKMAEQVGPFYDSSGVQSWLGISRQALQKRRESHKLISCRTADQHWIYPVWQFQDSGTLIPGLPEVLKVLATGINDGWTWALWLQSEVPDQLDGTSVVQWLTGGGDLQAVLQLAANDAAAWAA